MSIGWGIAPWGSGPWGSVVEALPTIDDINGSFEIQDPLKSWNARQWIWASESALWDVAIFSTDYYGYESFEDYYPDWSDDFDYETNPISAFFNEDADLQYDGFEIGWPTEAYYFELGSLKEVGQFTDGNDFDNMEWDYNLYASSFRSVVPFLPEYPFTINSGVNDKLRVIIKSDVHAEEFDEEITIPSGEYEDAVDLAVAINNELDDALDDHPDFDPVDAGASELNDVAYALVIKSGFYLEFGFVEEAPAYESVGMTDTVLSRIHEYTLLEIGLFEDAFNYEHFEHKWGGLGSANADWLGEFLVPSLESAEFDTDISGYELAENFESGATGWPDFQL